MPMALTMRLPRSTSTSTSTAAEPRAERAYYRAIARHVATIPSAEFDRRLDHLWVLDRTREHGRLELRITAAACDVVSRQAIEPPPAHHTQTGSAYEPVSTEHRVVFIKIAQFSFKARQQLPQRMLRYLASGLD